MDSGETFSIGFRTCNVDKRTGGEFIFLPEAKKFKRLTPAEIAAANNPREQLRLKKDPKHFENSTRNLMVPASGRIIKVHLRLITLFNGKQVL